MKLLATADLHLGLTRYGAPGADGVSTRIRDFEATLERFVNEAIDRGVALAIFAGDLFNTRREGYHERAAFTTAVARLQAAGITVIIIPGNHDGRSVIGSLESESLRWLHELNLPGVHVFLEPTWTVVLTRAGPAAIVVQTYPHKRESDADLPDISPADRVLLAGGALEKRIAAMAAEARANVGPETPLIFVGHLTVANSIAGSETAMQMGWDVAIRRETLAPFDLSVLGHIHRFQQLSTLPAWYVGSPEYIDFTEAGLEKAFLYANIDERKVGVIGVPTGARPMVTLKALAVEGEPLSIEEPDPAIWARGPIIHLVIRASERPAPDVAAKAQRALRERGASYVKTDFDLPATEAVVRERGESTMDATLDIYAATQRHLVAKGFKHTEAAMEAARTLLAQ